MNQENMLTLTKKQRKSLERIAKIMQDARLQFFLKGEAAVVKFGFLPIAWHAPIILANGTPVICPATMVADLLPTIDSDLTIEGIAEEYGDTVMRIDSYRSAGLDLVLTGEAYDGSQIEGHLPISSVTGDLDNREPCELRLLPFERIIVKRNDNVVFSVPEEA